MIIKPTNRKHYRLNIGYILSSPQLFTKTHHCLPLRVKYGCLVCAFMIEFPMLQRVRAVLNTGISGAIAVWLRGGIHELFLAWCRIYVVENSVIIGLGHGLLPIWCRVIIYSHITKYFWISHRCPAIVSCLTTQMIRHFTIAPYFARIYI